MNTKDKKLCECTFEELANAIYIKGTSVGREKITDKTGWREFVVAEKLGHIVHSKISCGKGSEKYGSDAYDPISNKFCEYKSQAITDKNLRNLFGLTKSNGVCYTPLKVKGVYNGAYTDEAIGRYATVDHYFSLFYWELCVLIIKVDTGYTIDTLTINNNNRKPGKTTNCNTVVISLEDTDHYTVAYKNQEWFDAHI